MRFLSVIDETLDVEKVDAYGMHSVPSTSGNPPLYQWSLSAAKYVMDEALSDETAPL